MPVPDRRPPKASAPQASSSQTGPRSNANNPFRPVQKTPLQKSLAPSQGHSSGKLSGNAAQGNTAQGNAAQGNTAKGNTAKGNTVHSRHSTVPPKSSKSRITPRSQSVSKSRSRSSLAPKFALKISPSDWSLPALVRWVKCVVTGWVKALWPIVVLLIVGAMITGGGLLSAKFILEPKSVAWLNDYLPEFLQIPLPEWDRPQTLADIERQIQKSNQTMGEVIELNHRERLIPIIRSGYNCISKCDRITELRIYRPAKANGPKRNEQHYRIVAQLAVGELEDWHVSTALSVSETGSSQTSGSPLPLETYAVMDSPIASSGHWFNLTGQRNQGEYKITYGQLFHYDAKSSTLTALVKWASPDEKQPIAWQQLTGSATPELMVNHTIGLEPSYQAYLVDLKSTPDLRLISLTQAPMAGADFRDAMSLIKASLWSLAADRLKQLKNSGGPWNSTAQAQFDLVQYHARLTRDQAQQNFASALQQVVAKLLDGRWKEAFTGLDKDPIAQQDIQESLKTETVRLWKRLSVAIAEDPGDPYLQAWMAAVMLDRDGLGKTRTWLNAQGASSIRSQVLQVIAPTIVPRPPKPEATPKPTPSISPADSPADSTSSASKSDRLDAEQPSDSQLSDSLAPDLPGNPRSKRPATQTPTPSPIPMPATF